MANKHPKIRPFEALERDCCFSCVAKKHRGVGLFLMSAIGFRLALFTTTTKPALAARTPTPIVLPTVTSTAQCRVHLCDVSS